MLFSSHVFLFVFLPAVLLGYFGLNRCCRSTVPGKLFLVAADLVFYGWFKTSYLGIMAGSILVNFAAGRLLYRAEPPWLRRGLLTAGILFNVLLIGYYKYTDFFIINANAVLGSNWPLRRVLLPLGISFFTFQQLAYLVDVYRRQLSEKYSLLTYALFVSFFPQLVAGPIVLPGEMMPQFEDPAKRRFRAGSFAPGLWLLAIGLAKKLILADNLAPLADDVFAAAAGGTVPDALSAWQAAAAYTLQIYFDFSGYCDMAMGIALTFNVTLPLNFNSPYRSINIQEFWRRWHMTLGRFLSQFIYFPLGGSRKGEVRACWAIMLTFLVSGIWHGAGWTFVWWGVLHGAALCCHRVFSRVLKLRMPRACAWGLTFLFVLLAWVLFRADSLETAVRVYRGMAAFSSPGVCEEFSLNTLFLLLAAFGFSVLPNAAGHLDRFRPNALTLAVTVALLTASVFFMTRLSPFIYFNF